MIPATVGARFQNVPDMCYHLVFSVKVIFASYELLTTGLEELGSKWGSC